MHYKYVFCILVYRNSEDLLECLNSIKEKVSNYKAVIVNSFYDEQTKTVFEKIATDNDCDFINVENKGYGYGNNRGIEFIRQNYSFDYIVVSNPDIIIERFCEDFSDENKDCVVAPLIYTLTGKAQNPYWLRKNPRAEKFIYRGQKRQNRFWFYLGVGINKIIREKGLKKFLKSQKRNMEVFASHGSFVLFPNSLFEKLGLFYDENMFLFSEEAYIAHVFEKANVKTVLTKDIKILHKEDGSMKVSKIDEGSENRKSVIYYYEKIVKTNKN